MQLVYEALNLDVLSGELPSCDPCPVSRCRVPVPGLVWSVEPDAKLETRERKIKNAINRKQRRPFSTGGGFWVPVTRKLPYKLRAEAVWDRRLCSGGVIHCLGGLDPCFQHYFWGDCAVETAVFEVWYFLNGVWPSSIM